MQNRLQRLPQQALGIWVSLAAGSDLHLRESLCVKAASLRRDLAGERPGANGPERFEGTGPLTLSVDASSPAAVARLYEGLLQIDTNGGRLRVPVRFRIALPIERLAGLIVLSLVYGALAGAATRFFYGLVNVSQ